jgi:hypothetical protein
MKREDVLNILIGLINDENRAIVGDIINRVNNLSDEQIKAILSSLKNSKTAVTAYLKQNIARELEKKQNMPDHKPINKMFTYGISGRTVHLHMPTNLMDVMKSNGLNGAISVVNLYLLDAIERIKELKNSGNKEFKMMNQIYMISPILIDRELQFLNDIEFNTKLYTKKDLQSNIFLLENKEAQLAVAIFGNQRNVGTASIDFNTLNTERWNRKKNSKINELKQRGYSIQELDEIE